MAESCTDERINVWMISPILHCLGGYAISPIGGHIFFYRNQTCKFHKGPKGTTYGQGVEKTNPQRTSVEEPSNC